MSRTCATGSWAHDRPAAHPPHVRHDLVDEYRLTVPPVALGDGLPLMHGLPEPRRFAMVSTTAYADGCVAQVFRPAD